MEVVSLGQQVRDLAAARGEHVALVFVPLHGTEVPVSFAELDRRSEQVAHLLDDAGIGTGDRVAIGLANSVEHVVAVQGAWKAGAGVVTLRWDVPEWERDRLIDATQPAAILGREAGVLPSGVRLLDISGADACPSDPLEDRVPLAPMAIPSGGSTGASKAVVLPLPGAFAPGTAFAPNYAMFGIAAPIRRHLIFGPLYHANPLLMLHAGMGEGQQVILCEKFDAAQVVALVARHRPEYMTLAPTMMRRILDVPEVQDVDWSCFQVILHGTAPTPEVLKRRFIDLVGAERLWEIFASSELTGSLVVRGDEWLEHPGTVGRPAPGTELRILDADQEPVPTGEVGEIYMRLGGLTTPLFSYLGGDQPKVTGDGFVSVGDLGSIDEEGYVYSADRRVDLIITGGANVVPAQVEAALAEHPDVADAVVIGLPDEQWGKRVHAIVVPRRWDTPPSEHDLLAHCRQRLAAYKVPKAIEFLPELPRTELFKIRRSELVAQRSQGSMGTSPPT